MNDIDKWAAEQVGIKFEQTWKGQVWRLNGKLHENDKWTIKDPRCREIVREHFKLYTYPTKYPKDIGNRGAWSCYQVGGENIAGGKTIAEAEIAAITVIYEASQ